MLNFSQIIPVAAKAAGDRPVLAAPYPLPMVVCRELGQHGIISGIVAQSAPHPTGPDPLIAGWWMGRDSGRWFLRRTRSRSMMLLSVESEEAVSGAMLLEARLKGYDRILLVGADGSVVNKIDTLSALLARIGTATTAPSYERAFEDMYALIGDRLRLPARAFDQERVLIYTPNLDAGGAQRQATYTALGLAARAPGTVVVARSRSGIDADDFYKPKLDEAGIPTFVMADDEEYSSPGIKDIRDKLAANYSSLGFLGIFHMIFNQALLIQTLRPGLVHTFQDYSNILAGIAADLVGVPRLVLGGRSVAPDNFGIFQPYMAPAYRALLLRRQVMFLNNSEAGANDYARWLGLSKDQFRVIHNGFEFPEKRPHMRAAQRSALGIPESAIVVGSIMGFREEKRPQLFLEMARLIHDAFPDVRFVIFGDGPLLPACRQFVRAHNLTELIHLPGLTENAWAALSAMEVFVLCSRIEGLPNVLIEAQAMGLPVVCTAGGGSSETFIEGKTGFGVSTATAEAIATTVSRLLSDKALCDRMGDAAFGHARRSFGIDCMIDATMDAYARTPSYRSDIVADWQHVDTAADAKIGGAVKDEGHCFTAALPPGANSANLYLWEDDHRLGPPFSPQQEIRSDGHGRYAVLGQTVQFSSSDNTDIRFNGHYYRLRPEDAAPDFEEIVISPEIIIEELGRCYVARMGTEIGSGRTSVWENDKRLGPGGCLHDEIRTRGMGCYSVWGSDLYFSTSDNTDPRKNGRSYRLRRGKKAATETTEVIPWSGAPLERAFRHMLSNAAPRPDFVPGRIVHVIGSLGPGGAERQTLYTLAGLSSQSFESVQLLCYYLAASGNERHDFYLPAFTAAGIPVRTIRRQVGDDDPASMPAGLRQVRHALPDGLAPDIADLFWEFVSLRPEIVHAWLDVNNIRAGLAAALAGVPRIIVSGRNVNPSHFDYIYRPEMHPAYRALLELPQVTMVNNSYAGRDDYSRWLGIEADRIAVVHNGCKFPAKRFKDLRRIARNLYEIPPDAIVVGTATRFSKEKRPHLFIEMAHHMLQKQSNLLFMFFGVGPLHDEVRGLVERLKISNSVRLMGVTDDIWKSLAAMDVFVLSSSMEGLPNVLIEAQCAGIPVIATNVGGAPEAFLDGKTGLGLDEATSETLAQALLQLTLAPDLRLKMSSAASAFARKEFALPRMIARTLKLYGRSEMI